jgi:hypothetical protein
MSFHSIITEENIPQLVRCKGRARHEMFHTTDCLLQAFSLVSHPGTRWVFTINVYPYFAPNNALDPGTTDQCSASLETDWCFKKGCNLPDTVALMRKKTTTLGVRCCRQNPIAKQSLWRNNFSHKNWRTVKTCLSKWIHAMWHVTTTAAKDARWKRQHSLGWRNWLVLSTGLPCVAIKLK